MNDIGFIGSDIATIGNIVPISDNIDRWDHQTVVLLVNDDNIDTVMRSFQSRRRPQSLYEGIGYKVHGFVNLNYSKNERRPENRNVRIVYCNMDRMSIQEVNQRFSDGYIMKVERSEDNGSRTPRISGSIPKRIG